MTYEGRERGNDGGRLRGREGGGRQGGRERERDTADLENFCVYQQCPDYLKMIANPMDIGTVSERLSAGAYVTATGTQFTRFTSTSVQILTQKAPPQAWAPSSGLQM
jgi:hypothetical protein